jgi:hypothetical protein
MSGADWTSEADHIIKRLCDTTFRIVEDAKTARKFDANLSQCDVTLLKRSGE